MFVTLGEHRVDVTSLCNLMDSVDFPALLHAAEDLSNLRAVHLLLHDSERNPNKEITFVANQIGVNPKTIYEWLKEAGVTADDLKATESFDDVIAKSSLQTLEAVAEAGKPEHDTPMRKRHKPNVGHVFAHYGSKRV